MLSCTYLQRNALSLPLLGDSSTSRVKLLESVLPNHRYKGPAESPTALLACQSSPACACCALPPHAARTAQVCVCVRSRARAAAHTYMRRNTRIYTHICTQTHREKDTETERQRDRNPRDASSVAILVDGRARRPARRVCVCVCVCAYGRACMFDGE